MTSRTVTMGCRLNAFESEVMLQEASKAGIGDAIIVNTCAVTAEAVRQSAQAIRRARREHPEARIVVTGCAAQIEPQRFAAMPEVDHVVGNGAKTAAATWTGLAAGTADRVWIDDIQLVRETAGHLISGFGARARAYVEVQNGCDHRCTFCVIPFGRGPSRSVPAGAVVASIRQLVEAGHGEVVLTGVDMTSYGSDLPGRPTLGRLVRQILRLVPSLKRLRLSSVDQIEVDDDLLVALAEEERLMPHLHLSLQSGDDMILKRMRRRHSRDDAIRFCAQARRMRPDLAFGADIIAGFPTETEAMFQRSLELVEACGIAYLHVFPYSSRGGTAAARMPQLERSVIRERAARLRKTGERALARHLDAHVGSNVTVMMERDSIGRMADFAEVVIPGGPATGLAAVTLTGHDGRRLSGKIAA